MRVRAVSTGVILAMLTAGCSRAPAEQGKVETTASVESVNAAAPISNLAEANVAAPVTAEPAITTASSVPDLPENEAVANGSDGAAPFPAEVTDFMVMRDGCDHFRGEEPYDAERRAFLTESVRNLCTGTDEKLATLRKRYAKDTDVMQALQTYEDEVE